MPTPSLLIVPARFKTGRLYSQIPTANGDFTVTRNTEARRFDSAGLVASVASGIPRLDYYTSGGVTGCPALLVEPSGTNLIFGSQTWNAANNWKLIFGTARVTSITGSTIEFTAPDGTLTANELSPTSGNTSHTLESNSSANSITGFTSGTIYTGSAFFKKGTGVAGRYIQMILDGSRFTQLGYVNFDLELGIVTVVSGSSADANRTARIENYGNGWYRCSFTATCNSSGSGIGIAPFLITASGSILGQNFSGTVTDKIYGWGAQLETGSVATSYIPTAAASGSRSADVISVSGAVSGSIGQTEGTLYIECQSEFATNDIIVINTAGQSPGNNYLSITKTSLNRFSAAVVAGGTTVSFTETSGITSFAKIAIAYASGNTACFINGLQIGSTSATGFTFNGALNNITFISNMVSGTKTTRIRAAALYTTRLTNAELASLTSP